MFQLVEKICRYNNQCQSGKIATVIEELRVPPPSCPVAVHQVVDDENESNVSYRLLIASLPIASFGIDSESMLF